MMKKIDTTPQFFTRAEAEKVAQVMQADDPDWTYIAKHPTKGYSKIFIYDEEGEFVAFA